MKAIGVIIVLIAAWSVALWLWAFLFPPKCKHGRKIQGNVESDCADCRRERAEGEAALRDRAEVARQDEERKRCEIDRLRMIEAENLRQLSYLQSMDPTDFEQVVLQAYRNLGWEASATARTCDEGIDGHLVRNGQRFILQCKRFSSGRVGSPVVRDLLGATKKEDAAGGILVTTSSFTEEAAKWARGQPLTLVDGVSLVSLIQQAFPIGSLVPAEFVAKKVAAASLPNLCPRCGCPTQTRNGRFGAFLGCTGFPDCRWLMNLPAELGGRVHSRRRRRGGMRL